MPKEDRSSLNKTLVSVFYIAVIFVILTVVAVMRNDITSPQPILLLQVKRQQLEVVVPSMKLFNKSSILDSWLNCTTNITESLWHHLLLCSPNSNDIKQADLVLFTSIYHSTKKDYIFNITVENWLLLKPHVLPVLFLTDVTIIRASGSLVQKACEKGWVVAIAPRCLHSGYPLLNTMYKFVLMRYNASWYGYANGDIIYSKRLWMVLKQIKEKKNVPRGMSNFSFVTSRTYSAYISRAMHIRTVADALEKAKNINPQSSVAIDMFIYHKSADILKNMPRFAVGRRGYDNWLVYQALSSGLNSLDITNVSTAIHLSILGLTKAQNSHRSKRKDSEYNMRLPQLRNGFNAWFSLGRINCIPNMAMELHADNKTDYKSDFQFTVKQRSSKELCPAMLKRVANKNKTRN